MAKKTTEPMRHPFADFDAEICDEFEIMIDENQPAAEITIYQASNYTEIINGDGHETTIPAGGFDIDAHNDQEAIDEFNAWIKKIKKEIKKRAPKSELFGRKKPHLVKVVIKITAIA